MDEPYFIRPGEGERLDRGYRAFAECRAHISKPPSEFLKGFYYDTVNFNPDAVRLAIAFAGVDHILAGSDYPHQIGSIPLMIDTIRRLDVDEPTRAAILLLPAPANHCRSTSFVSTLVTSRYAIASSSLPRPNTAARAGSQDCASSHPAGGKDFEKLPLRGGEGSEKSSPRRGESF